MSAHIANSNGEAKSLRTDNANISFPTDEFLNLLI